MLSSCSKPPPASHPQTPSQNSAAPGSAAPQSEGAKANSAAGETKVLIHNVILDEPAGYKLRVRWLRGEMRPTRPGVTPSFDDSSSFVLAVEDGVIAINLSDVAAALNNGMLKGTPLSNVSLADQGKRSNSMARSTRVFPCPSR